MPGFLTRNKVTLVTAALVAVLSSGTAVAASYLVLATTNTATATTTLRSAVNGAVLSIQNTNTSGGTSARGLSITVPAGRAPIVVSSTAGKATYLNADRLDGYDSTAFVRKSVEAWHEVGAVGEPPFIEDCGAVTCRDLWGNYGNGWRTVAYFKDPLGMVHLKGLALHKDVTTVAVGCYEVEPIFILPEGYRPEARASFASISDNNAARIDIDVTGHVRACFPTFTPTRGWSLEGITFRAAP